MHTSFLVGCDQKTRLWQLVKFMGLPEDAVSFVRYKDWDQVSSGIDSQDRKPLVIELGSGLDGPLPQAWPDILLRGGNRRDIFFFGLGSAGPNQNPGAGAPPDPPPDRLNTPVLSEIRFSDDALWGPLQGLCSKWPLSSQCLPPASLALSGSCEPLMTIRDRPWFLRRRGDGPTAFIWAAAHLPDILEPLGPTDPEKDERLLRVLPLLVFLRHAFGKRTWHVPTCFANLIIDDPPVRDRHGSFEPARHLASLVDIPHATTVAFIPWYWNRSTAATAEFFRNHSAQLSLCVHGCDHSGGEFANFDQATLSSKCQLALLRSEWLRERTGLACEPVMVFPQALFTKAAVAALRETHFLGAVNSTLFAVDEQPGDVRVADLMQPAYTSIEDFPIFLRRYPRDPVLCAVDIFLGRHLLLVEHEEYFRHGYTECRRFLEAVNGFRCSLSWVPLDQIVRRACLQREIEPGWMEVRFYTNTFILENPSSEKLSFRLMRRCSRPELIRGVVVNGSPVAHGFGDGQVTLALEMHPQTSATVHLVENGLRVIEPFKGSFPYRARVWVRRRLCDLRANHVWVSQCARWARQALHRGSNSG